MGEVTGIQWCDHTANFWIGCTEASAGCTACYARELSGRYGFATWGLHEPRHRTGTSTWTKPFAWDRKAKAEGVRRRVFCMSLADMFDNEVPEQWRIDAFDVIRRTPNLDWQILTKRPLIAKQFLTKLWGNEPWPHVWIGASVENQQTANVRIPTLLSVPASVRFLSVEPLIEEVDLSPFVGQVDWFVLGGESGKGARPMKLSWVRRIVTDCQGSGSAVFVKQMGVVLAKEMGLKDHKGGRIEEWPEDLRVREYPSFVARSSAPALALF